MKAIKQCVIGKSPAVVRGVAAPPHSVERSILDTPSGRAFSHLVTCLAVAPSCSPCICHSMLCKHAVDTLALPTDTLMWTRLFQHR